MTTPTTGGPASRGTPSGRGDGVDAAGQGDVDTPSGTRADGHAEAPGGSGGDTPPMYVTVDDVVWRPLYDHKAVTDRASSLTLAGAIAGGVVLLACVVVAVIRDDVATELLTLGVAAAAGLFLVLSGIGLLTGETLYAVEKTTRVPVEPDVRLRSLTGGGLGTVVTGLADGLKGLTPGRALVFAGTALLIGLAVGGGLAAGGSEEDGESTGTPSAPVSQAPSPAATTGD